MPVRRRVNRCPVKNIVEFGDSTATVYDTISYKICSFAYWKIKIKRNPPGAVKEV
jgi:hypothetical protein